MTKGRTVGLLLFLGTLAVFWPLREAGFVNYDDPGYVYENARVSQGLTLSGATWAFSSFHKANWHPLTWLSHMLDVELFGLDAGAHHLVNILLHALNAVVLFAFLRRASGAVWLSALVAALFAVHPLHVESVAWISERKDVLSSLFFLLALFVYVGWVRRGGGWRYAAVVLCMVGGLLAKPMVVTLPFVLLLVDVWPLARVSLVKGRGMASRLVDLVVEKLPLFALAIAACVVTLLAQRAGGAVVELPGLSLGARIANAVVAYVWYLQKAIWPTGLAVLYPHPILGGGVSPDVSFWLGSAALLVVASGFCVWQSRARPYLLIGWLWFLGTLVPVIGLVQVGVQATADRYSYIPLIGIFIATVWGLAELSRGAAWLRAGAGVLAGVWLLLCAMTTRAQLAHWQGAKALAARAVLVTPENFVMRYNLALALQAEGSLEAAREQYEEAIRIEPEMAALHNGLAALLMRRGEFEEGVARYRVAMMLPRGRTQAANNLAWFFATHPDPKWRRGTEALRLATMAEVATQGADPNVLDTLAAAQAETGDFRAALRTNRRALALARTPRWAIALDELENRESLYRQGMAYRDPELVTPDRPR